MVWPKYPKNSYLTCFLFVTGGYNYCFEFYDIALILFYCSFLLARQDSSSIEVFSTPCAEMETFSETLSTFLMTIAPSSLFGQPGSSAVDIDLPFTQSVSHLPTASCVGFCSVPRSSPFDHLMSSSDLVAPTASGFELLLTPEMHHTLNPSAGNQLAVASSDVVVSSRPALGDPLTSSLYQTENPSANNPVLVMSFDIAVSTPSPLIAWMTPSVYQTENPSANSPVLEKSSDITVSTPPPLDAWMTSSVYQTENLSARTLASVSSSNEAVSTALPIDLSMTSSAYRQYSPSSDINLPVTSTYLAVLATSSYDLQGRSTPPGESYIPDALVPSASHFVLPVTSSSHVVISPSIDVSLIMTSPGLPQILPSSSNFNLGLHFSMTSSVADDLHVTAVYDDYTRQSESIFVLTDKSETPSVEPPTVTVVVSSRSVRKACNKTCFCQPKGSLNKNDLLMSQILERLSIDTKNTSAYRRHHTSASDQRMVARSLGWGGICLLCMLGALILLSDAPILVQDSFNAFHNIMSVFPPRPKSRKNPTMQNYS